MPPIVNETENKSDVGIIVLPTDRVRSLPCGGVKIISTVIYSGSVFRGINGLGPDIKSQNIVITTLNQWNDLKTNIKASNEIDET
ncbi:MAG: hypothetical protein ACK50L_10065 [Bacteroidota bacterium]